MYTVEDLIGQLNELVRVDPEDPQRLVSRENSRLEYKERFNWANRDKYGKTLAAFANNVGGFIVFGVSDSPRTLVGVNEDRFDALDPATVSAYLNSSYAPELEWEVSSTDISGVRLGFIYVAPAKTRPVLSLRNNQEAREADIYFRYRGRTERIRYSELQTLLTERQQAERDYWMEHLSRVARIGIDNVGVLDLVSGELSGRRGRLLVTGELLDKVKFIQEGHFAESDEPGAPTLRLVGDVQAVPAESLTPVQAVPMVIGEKELMLAFLRDEQPEAPLAYLRQACRELSSYMPMYYFARRANLQRGQLRDFIRSESPSNERLLIRIEDAGVTPIGTLEAATAPSVERRNIFEAIVGGEVESLRDRDRNRLFETITHFHPTTRPTVLLEFLAELVETEFDALPSGARTNCRKSVAKLDEALNREVTSL